jgi:hypothetical protein
MDFKKEYMIQSITAAANHLRLTSDKIESVTLLKEYLTKSKDIQKVVDDMKKVTELSKLGVRLNEILNFLNSDRIDFATLSETFKEQSHRIVKEVSYFLEITSPDLLKSVFESLEKGTYTAEVRENMNTKSGKDVAETSIKEEAGEAPDAVKVEAGKSKDEKLPEVDQKILDEADLTLNLINPLRELAAYINDIEEKKSNSKSIDHYIDLAKSNLNYAKDRSYPEIPKMMGIVIKTFEKVKLLQLSYNSDVIEGLRCCLIVSLAQVKKKNVDISGYIEKAERFGEKILK